MSKNPMPTVDYQGRTYKLRSRNTEVPDFTAMSELDALVWINKYTVPRGYQKEKIRIGGIELNLHN